jgi:acyl-CoA reductase-like NAD-dependent aldehyde dehydrogenase
MKCDVRQYFELLFSVSRLQVSTSCPKTFHYTHTKGLKEDSMSASQIVSINPATEEVNATFEPTSARNVDRALRLASAAAQTWRALPVSERAKSLFAMADALRANRERLARHITQEMGKPLLESLAEVDKSARCCEFYAEHGPAMLADQPVSTSAKRSYVSFEPLGLVLAVMPWNFPLWQVFRFAPPTLLAGNGIVLKHAPNVPQCALDIADIIDQVCPPGLFTTLLVGTEQVADLIADDRIHAITLTGSTQVGQQVAATAAGHLKRQVLELGGSDPFIVLADADVAAAAAAAVSARNDGPALVVVADDRRCRDGVHGGRSRLLQERTVRVSQVAGLLHTGRRLGRVHRVDHVVHAQGTQTRTRASTELSARIHCCLQLTISKPLWL